MAKIEKKAKEDHSNDWLSTYGDMVTLLLTFFVLLYASSSQDEQKFQYIYQAFTSHGKYLNEYVDSPNPVPGTARAPSARSRTATAVREIFRRPLISYTSTFRSMFPTIILSSPFQLRTERLTLI